MSRHRYSTWLLLCLLAVSCSAGKKDEPPPAESPPPLEPSELPRLGPGIHQQTASLPGGGALRYTISVPPGYDSKKPAPLVVALHYGGVVTHFYGRGMIDGLVGPALADLGAVIVAPDAQDGDWTTPKNEQAVVWLTRSIQKSYAIDPKKVLLTGFSMGGQGTWFIGSRHQDLFTAAIPVAGGPVGGTSWTIPVYVIHSRDDEVLALGPTQQHVERLKEHGAKVELKVLTGLTHYQTPRYSAALKETLPWLRRVWD
jgi:predicted peptidase